MALLGNIRKYKYKMRRGRERGGALSRRVLSLLSSFVSSSKTGGGKCFINRSLWAANVVANVLVIFPSPLEPSHYVFKGFLLSYLHESATCRPSLHFFFFFESSCLLIEDPSLLFVRDRPFTIEMKVAIAKENLSIIFHFVSGALLFLSLVSWQCVAKIDPTSDHRSIVTWFALTSQRETETLLRQG